MLMSFLNELKSSAFWELVFSDLELASKAMRWTGQRDTIQN